MRPNGRAAEVVRFEESVVAFFLGSASALGVPKSLAAIYGICFASPQPLSFSDVKERLDISAGSISQGLRILKEIGALKVVTTETDKREFFTPDLELRKLVAHYLEQRLEKQLNSGGSALRDIETGIPAGNGGDKILQVRLKQLQNWHEKINGLLPLAKAFLQHI